MADVEVGRENTYLAPAGRVGGTGTAVEGRTAGSSPESPARSFFMFFDLKTGRKR
jgi:hypothetical protein